MQTVPLWVPFAVAGVGLIGAIGAAIAGAMWKARGDLEQWRRNLRVAAYQQYATVTTEFLHAATVLYGEDRHPGNPGWGAAARALQEANRQADVSATLTQMIAPREVQREVSRTQASGVEIFDLATPNPPASRAKFEAASDKYIKAQDLFLAKVQKDLGFTGYVLMRDNRPSTEPSATRRERALVWFVGVIVTAALIGVVLLFRH